MARRNALQPQLPVPLQCVARALRRRRPVVNGILGAVEPHTAVVIDVCKHEDWHSLLRRFSRRHGAIRPAGDFGQFWATHRCRSAALMVAGLRPDRHSALVGTAGFYQELRGVHPLCVSTGSLVSALTLRSHQLLSCAGQRGDPQQFSAIPFGRCSLSLRSARA